MIQQLIHRFEEGAGIRYLRYALLALFGAGLILSYNLRGFKNMSNPEAMDTAQLARNIALHKGYTTLFIRPFSLFLVQRADTEKYGQAPVGDARDRSMIRIMHPDLANPPVYPLLLAGLMKLQPKFQYQLAGSQHFWNRGGNFWIYEPDFLIGLFNQVLFFIAVGVVFFFASRLFDPGVAWTAAGIFLGTDLFWRFSISGLSTMLLILIFLALCGALMVLEKLGREANARQAILVALAAANGVILGIGCLTRYSFGFLVLPVLFFLILFLGRHRVILCLTVLAAFAVIISPWVYRNYRISHTPFGVAGYAIYENTADFPENRLERSLDPDISRVHYNQIWYKFVGDLQMCLQDDLPRLGGSWISAFFLVGLLLPYKNPALNRLRYFLLLCLPVLMIAQSLCRTALSEDNPVINSENLIVLLAPLIIMFGISLFYMLLDQINLPSHQFRYLIITLFCVILCLPAIIACIPFTPMTNPVVYPPYKPPIIQMAANWMKENELMMSDVPWAVAWYGKRQCIWLTLNAQTDFYDVYDYQKPVKAVYLTQVTMDARFLTQWVRVENSWGSFVLEGFLKHELPPDFPLRRAPAGFLPEQLFITDVDRWSKPKAKAAIPSE